MKGYRLPTASSPFFLDCYCRRPPSPFLLQRCPATPAIPAASSPFFQSAIPLLSLPLPLPLASSYALLFLGRRHVDPALSLLFPPALPSHPCHPCCRIFPLLPPLLLTSATIYLLQRCPTAPTIPAASFPFSPTAAASNRPYLPSASSYALLFIDRQPYLPADPAVPCYSLQRCPATPPILAVTSSSPCCPHRDPHLLPSAITFFPLPRCSSSAISHCSRCNLLLPTPPHRLQPLLSANHLSSSPPLQQPRHPQPLLVAANRQPSVVANLSLQPFPPLLAASPLLPALTAAISSAAQRGAAASHCHSHRCPPAAAANRRPSVAAILSLQPISSSASSAAIAASPHHCHLLCCSARHSCFSLPQPSLSACRRCYPPAISLPPLPQPLPSHHPPPFICSARRSQPCPPRPPKDPLPDPLPHLLTISHISCRCRRLQPSAACSPTQQRPPLPQHCRAQQRCRCCPLLPLSATLSWLPMLPPAALQPLTTTVPFLPRRAASRCDYIAAFAAITIFLFSHPSLPQVPVSFAATPNTTLLMRWLWMMH
ncbi:hypothetical protein BHE74_00048612 [Ensete ventricosum]|nr:hypothetical protein BHE74_00048612 [Ensete ventricosum]